mgnify:CR=1 FL=1
MGGWLNYLIDPFTKAIEKAKGGVLKFDRQKDSYLKWKESFQRWIQAATPAQQQDGNLILSALPDKSAQELKVLYHRKYHSVQVTSKWVWGELESFFGSGIASYEAKHWKDTNGACEYQCYGSPYGYAQVTDKMIPFVDKFFKRYKLSLSNKNYCKTFNTLADLKGLKFKIKLN